MTNKQMIDGVLVVDKPRGVTSFDVVRQVRRLFGQKKVGHAGTLDPSVAGVLVVALGKATKLIDELQTRPKRYIGEITLGFATETEDLDGAVIARKTIDTPIATTTIDAAIKVLNGAIKQIPPMYSAVKVNGRRLYDYARAGEIVMRPERDAMIYDFHRTSDVNFENNVQKFNFEATVSKGTYIRTLASDTGKALDIPATMTSLTRTMGSGFTLIQAHDLTEVEKLAPDDLLQIIVPIKDILTWPTHILSDDEWFAVKNGQKIAHWEPSTNFKQLYYNDKLKAVYQYDNSEQVWRSRYVFDNQ
ncbi:tRNA pseudouridine(55) synthase TruB [Leuconostoc pseudomesenteroides]|jgi:tRNA pseudouridine55 synthase|uniref:tRNA pseudouridine synthase B n=1 Tax=Leuconostoc falkenbergense TaxID=2766470 RepID=A0A9X3EIA3_9LACO|nr:tRNA pseudouridine(55) synthase TruB [Leuconostoc falkenbergense]RDG19570.1 tRNA pseudouridine(55) synthase TruB [Leuconostoc pseudomesenteroides]MCT4378487.1 tRNA pseudouridine(55) synthase TruB [Leuconostoc falkenbergense]MCT4389402.1 tRNA pseudouridine(55) synthase TruB [Leuconostoc falkenbergense]MCT4410580.1 tRNA pseudouridine(55) synthase TruB [Leuconostoc falkenbergense]MCX7579315.1 tRNA pseudouridine(55) synthase TruB [Leuconostoc falkenbergense]